MRWVFLFVCAGCGVTPPPEAPSGFALRSMQGATILRYRVHDDTGDSLRDVAVDGGSFAEESGSNVTGSTGAVAWRKRGSETIALEGNDGREGRNASAWLGLEFAHPFPGDRLDVESCARDRCTLVFVPKGGSAVWLDVDRATRRPTSIQWIDTQGAIESCESLVFDRDGSAIASATCTRILHGVGHETRTWALVEKHSEPSLPSWARGPAVLSPTG